MGPVLRSVTGVPLQAQEVRQLLSLFDADGNGAVSKLEFSTFMTWAVLRSFFQDQQQPPKLDQDGDEGSDGGAAASLL